ncbi:hypothetical protein CVT24_011693, partial [Panaeolus cyanescens]
RLDGTKPDKELSTSKKRVVSRKKQSSAGVWPCQIGGCNKQFAREADLKRHQRTTKSHSMPSLLTDALRRHQKSRHDGVVVDGNGSGRSGDENVDYNQDDFSKGKDRAGPSSYYRSHTAITTPHIPRFYANPLGVPTSSTRQWSTVYPPWPPEGPAAYPITPTLYYPSPHYRPHTSNYHADRSPASQTYSTSSGFSQSPTSTRTSRNSSTQPSVPPSGNDTTTSNTSELDVNLEGPELTTAEVVAALQSALGMRTEPQDVISESMQHERIIENHGNHGHLAIPTETGVESGLSDDDLQQIGLDELHKFASFVRSDSMEHILTEDGEPMLNPAELLTQESLAESPPPS